MARSVSGKTTRTTTRTTTRSTRATPKAASKAPQKATSKTAKAATTAKTATRTAAASKATPAKSTSKTAAAKPRTPSKASARKGSTKTAVLATATRTATITSPDRGEPVLASGPRPPIERGGAGLTNIEAQGDQPLNIPPVFRQDSKTVIVNARVGQHNVDVSASLLPGSATATSSVGSVEMFFDTRQNSRGKWRDVTFDLNGRAVRLFRGYIHFTDDEPAKAVVFSDEYYGDDTYGFYAVMPFSRMAPMVQIFGGYPNSYPSISFMLKTADDDVSVLDFRLSSGMREEAPEPRRKPKKKK